ncbi:MAG: phenylacetate--CoA ligase family protein [Clostridiaceae bacterium]
MIKDLVKNGKKYYDHNKMERNQILNYREKKFRKLIKLAYEKSEFYRELYENKGIKYKDLDCISIEDLPIINKDLVRDNSYNILTKNINEEKVKQSIKKDSLLPKVGDNYIIHTSGTTGIPCNFFYHKSALNILESNFARLSLLGDNKFTVSDFPIKSLYIAPVGSGYASSALANFGLKEYHCKSIIINAKSPMNTWIDKIVNYNPLYLSGYPSCIDLLASLQEQGKINIHPKKIITGGEPLSKENTLYYKKIFDADVVDQYGCTESILIGAGSSEYEGMYLFDDLNYVEVDNKNRLIITPLYNPLFPLIRYQLTDVLEGYDDSGKYKLPYTHIDRVIGREEEMMWFCNIKGEVDFLHPMFLDDLSVLGIEKYQFIQRDKESFTILCVKNSDFSDKTIKNTREQLEKFLEYKDMNNVKYDIIFVDEIKADNKTGKTKLVIKI